MTCRIGGAPLATSGFRACLRETIFDVHDKAFALFGAARAGGIHDSARRPPSMVWMPRVAAPQCARARGTKQSAPGAIARSDVEVRPDRGHPRPVDVVHLRFNGATALYPALGVNLAT